jgi:hypothetical protein
MRTAAVVLASLVLGAASAGAGPVEDARRDVLAATRIYRESLERVARVHEAEAARATERAEHFARLFEQGLVARQDVEDARRLAAIAAERVTGVRREMAQAEMLAAEAEARSVLAALPPPRPDAYHVRPALIRYDGAGAWSLAMVPRLERFFARAFGRPLPVSAIGQTPVHDRLGFDHGDAVDLAVHPDTAEGRALMDHLRSQRIPFIAYRRAVAGSATGAHIHVGPPSDRVARRR